jgi:dihydroorotate dehydrogenase (fumarate)
MDLDLTTNYLGLRLRNPLIASAGPLSRTAAGVRRLADAGVGAVVLPSLFEEQIDREAGRDARSAADPPIGPDEYLTLIERAAATAGVPVIASLNGVTTGGWTDYAAAMERAGAAAIELNIYPFSADPLTPGSEVEQRHVEVLTTVKAAVTIPVAVKIAPYFSSPGEFARRLDRAGADGLVLFNRFMQTGIDAETLAVSTGLELSRPAEASLPLMWIARLHSRIEASLAASTGVEDAADVAAFLLAGADVVMTTSALLRHGPDHAAALLDGLTAWMDRKGFTSVERLRGKLAAPVGAGGPAYARSGYLSTLQDASRAYGPSWRDAAEPAPAERV